MSAFVEISIVTIMITMKANTTAIEIITAMRVLPLIAMAELAVTLRAIE